MRFLRFLLSVLAVTALALPLSASASTLEKIKAKKSIALGYRDASVPFSYLGDDGKPRGYSVELCSRVAEAVRTHLGLPSLDIRWVLVDPSNRIAKVKNGDIDLECGSTTANFTRLREVDFSFLTFVDGGGYLTSNAANINRLADLKGKKNRGVQGDDD